MSEIWLLAYGENGDDWHSLEAYADKDDALADFKGIVRTMDHEFGLDCAKRSDRGEIEVFNDRDFARLLARTPRTAPGSTEDSGTPFDWPHVPVSEVREQLGL